MDNGIKSILNLPLLGTVGAISFAEKTVADTEDLVIKSLRLGAKVVEENGGRVKSECIESGSKGTRRISKWSDQ
ncbi:hypothetical protein AX774_g6875 [Zancudomyces culisetae]|uniref:Uncharacterized protein n=1 Tax=Zancudomyces culisetae TaxID=1213189 RepID=A0A1R1PFE3_ZANCU|nr:hypothetical protein AX774_g6875 [Zancudomyces culisetae]|eukprot:OMH79704.1 hypothetical protein AX774_g6875 [Zancudomyces culisetae]